MPNYKIYCTHAFARMKRTLVMAVTGFGDQKLNIRANHLTYSFLFALVPIMALVFAVAKGFGLNHLIEQQISQYASAASWLIDLQGVVNRYIETANRGLFIGIGILILIGAVYIFFRNVELAFNEIWNVQQTRSILRQSVNYIAILFLIPILVIVSSSLNLYLHTTAETWIIFQFLAPYRDSAINWMQFIILTTIFTWIYIAIPNTKVRFRSGVIPGLITAALLMGIEALSVQLMLLLSRTSIVYGAFAFLPILLIIIKWLCLIILIGSELSYSIQNNEDFTYRDDLQTMSRRYKDFLTIYIFCIIIQRFEHQQPPLTAPELASQVGVPVRQVSLLLSRLEEVGLLHEIYIEDKTDLTYQPACSTHHLTLATVLDKIDEQGTEDFIPANDQVRSQWQHFIRTRQEQNASQTIYMNELFNEP